MKSLKLKFSVIICFVSLISAAQSRVVLIEQFTNSSCGPCGAVSPSVYAFGDANPSQVAVVAYHTLFPYNNDSMYFENPVDANQRVSFYQVNSVPHTVLDGSVFAGSTNSFFSGMPGNVNARLAVAPQYSIELVNLSYSSGMINGNVRFTSLNNLNAMDSLVAHIVVVEKNVLKSSYSASPGANSENQYGYVMRKMIPSASGTKLYNKTINGSLVVGWSGVNLNNIKNTNELRLVGFVQNENSKEILQAIMFTVPIVVGLDDKEEALNQVTVFPNPGSAEFSVLLTRPQWIHEIKIINQLGAVVHQRQIEEVTTTISQHHELPPGIYFVTVTGEKGNYTRKLIVNR